MSNILGVHYVIDLYGCDADKLKSVLKIKKIMNKAGIVGSFNIVKKCFHKFKPYGVSGVMILKESHFTIHTWPEYNYAAVDIFLCDIELNIDNVIKYLSEQFSTNDYLVKKIDRGII